MKSELIKNLGRNIFTVLRWVINDNTPNGLARDIELGIAPAQIYITSSLGLFKSIMYDDTTTVEDFEVWYRSKVNPPEDPIDV